MKHCNTCDTDKPLSEFSRKGDRLQAKCKACTKIYYSDYYHNGPKEKERLVARRKQIRVELQAKVWSLKDNPCTDCGKKFHPVAMDFDHLEDNKYFSIADAISYGVNWIVLEAEIAKCELVCSNCHRVRTYKRQRIHDSIV